MKAVVTNIQRFSIHDGAGIRTAIFFKGCPLACTWCANPETQQIKIQLSWERENCVHCLSCVNACPEKCLRIDEKFCHDLKLCKECGKCSAACPTGALQNYGKKYYVDEIVAEVMKDKEYYDDSSGGVTFSGGEFLMQSHFVIKLAEKLHEKNIHVAGETSGFAPTKIFSEILKSLDFLYIDVKHHDREKHKKFTGVYPDVIRENLKIAINSGLETVVRIPVIPKINDSLDDAKNFVELFQKLGVKKIQLLPFHNFGQKKYDTLGREYDFANELPLNKNNLQDYLKIFTDAKIDANF